jgi:hypothetical protein
MALHTVGLLAVKVIDTNSGVEEVVSAFGSPQVDLLDEIEVFFRKVKADGGSTSKERYFTTVRVTPEPTRRLVHVEIDYGRFGSARRVREQSTGRETGVVKDTEVASDELRLSAAVPSTDRIALLAYEVAGQASCVGPLSQALLTSFHKANPGFTLDISYLEDTDAWDEYLKGAELKSLTFVTERQSLGNRASLPLREEHEVRPSGRGQSLPRKWLKKARKGSLRATDVLSVKVKDSDVENTRIVVAKDGRRRTVVIGGDWPKFTWEIDPTSRRRPTTTKVRKVAYELIKTRLAHRNIPFP